MFSYYPIKPELLMIRVSGPEFRSKSAVAGAEKPVFSCNCILNYLYGGLEGEKIPPYAGPITFGEVAYQLLNQTLAYCEIV